jgi:cyanophycinase
MPAPDQPVAEMEKLLNKATGIYFAGGSQRLLEKRLEHTGTSALIRQLHLDNRVVVAGSSAGTAIFSECMIAGSGDIPQNLMSEGFVQHNGLYTGGGLGLMTNVVFDQHFLKRGRLDRLITATYAAPEHVQWGIGVEEAGAGIVVNRQYVFPIGANSVTIVTRRNDMSSAEHFQLSPVEYFDLETGIVKQQVDAPFMTGQARGLSQQSEQHINDIAGGN